MRVQGQLLPPGMENGDHPGVGSQMFRVLGKAADRLPGSFKQTVIDGPGLIHGQRIQRGGQREHHMEVRYRKELSLPLGDPILPVFALTFRTMTVTAAVVADPGTPACFLASVTAHGMPRWE